MKRFILIFLALQFVSYQAWSLTGEQALVRGVALFNIGQQKAALDTLESSFQKIQKSLSTQKQRDIRQRSIDGAWIALVLALSPSSKKLRQGRNVYVDFVLKHHPSLSIEMHRRLVRIRAESYEEQGKLRQARRAYQALLSFPQGTQQEKEYATHRLGWVYLQQRQALRAFRLWQNWLNQYGEGLIRERIVEDLGRAWVWGLLSGKRPGLRSVITQSKKVTGFLQGVRWESRHLSQGQRQQVEQALQTMGLWKAFGGLPVSRKDPYSAAAIARESTSHRPLATIVESKVVLQRVLQKIAENKLLRFEAKLLHHRI